MQFSVGDRVKSRRVPTLVGTITAIDGANIKILFSSWERWYSSDEWELA